MFFLYDIFLLFPFSWYLCCSKGNSLTLAQLRPLHEITVFCCRRDALAKQTHLQGAVFSSIGWTYSTIEHIHQVHPSENRPARGNHRRICADHLRRQFAHAPGTRVVHGSRQNRRHGFNLLAFTSITSAAGAGVGAGEDDPPPESVASLLGATSFWMFVWMLARAQGLWIRGALQDAWRPGCVWLGVRPGAKPPRSDVTMWCGIGLISCQMYRSVRYRVDVVPILTKCPGPVSMRYRQRYRLRYTRAYGYRRRYGINVVLKLPMRPVPVVMSY